jgi:hypothetical protein
MTIIEAPEAFEASVEDDGDEGRDGDGDPATASGDAGAVAVVVEDAAVVPSDLTGIAVLAGAGAPDEVQGVDPAYAVEAPGAVPPAGPETAPEPADATVTDPAYLVEDTGPDGPPVETAPAGSLAAAVADHLAGDGVPAAEPDGHTEAAQAVLDVLRASGWSDSAETTALKAEVERLRELLDMVVRDHRARVATAVNGQHQQAYWLVPLLRAAHGVAFGTLGAKVHLRTAVQDVPPDVLASAGLRIDDSGPLPEPDPRA